MAKHRKMLGDCEDQYIQSLIKLVETQSKTTLANWCIDYSELRLLPIYEMRRTQDNDKKIIKVCVSNINANRNTTVYNNDFCNG